MNRHDINRLLPTLLRELKKSIFSLRTLCVGTVVSEVDLVLSRPVDCSKRL